MENEECKVTYRDGDIVRALRGRVEMIGNFVKVKRRDAIILLNQDVVMKIEKRKEEDEVRDKNEVI